MKTKTTALYHEYKSWSEISGWRWQLNVQWFGRKLNERWNIKRPAKRFEGKRWYLSVILRENEHNLHKAECPTIPEVWR